VPKNNPQQANRFDRQLLTEGQVPLSLVHNKEVVRIQLYIISGGREMTKRMSEKMLSSLAVAIMLIFVLVTSINAASHTVYIDEGDGPVQSGSITATNGANYDGHNSSGSGHRLYITLQSSSGSGWTDQKVALMDIGQSASGYSAVSGDLLWRVQLNPQYAYTDCIGWGTISNR